MKKKALALLMTSTIALSAASVPVFASDFTDMPNNWSTEALKNAVSNGLLKGNDGKIRPTDSLMRSEMATIINRAFNSQKQAAISNFTDVKQSDWFYTEMAKAVAMKTFQGSGNKLSPTDNITREEVFVVLARAFNIPKTTDNSLGNFVDQANVSSWAREEVAALVSEGYISGSNGYINPKQNITRAEFAKMMDNLVKTYISSGAQYTSNYTGNVIINKANVSLKGSTITGDLIIGDGVGDGDIVLDDVTVTGRLVVRGGGANSIKIVGNSKIKDIIVARVDGKVKVHADSGTVTGKVIIDGDAEVVLEGVFGQVFLNSSNAALTARNAYIDSISVSGTTNQITVDANSTVNHILANGKSLIINNSGSVKKVTAGSTATGVILNGVVVQPGTTADEEVKNTFVKYINADAMAEVTLPSGADVTDYAVLVTGLDGSNPVTDKIVAINPNKEVMFSFTNNSAYTLKLVKLSDAGTILDQTTFITNYPTQNLTTLKVVNSNRVTKLDNTSSPRTLEVEYNSTVSDLLSAIETTDSAATVKVLSKAAGSGGYEVAGSVKASNPMVVEVTAKDGTTKTEYNISTKTGLVNTVKITDANIASKTSSTITVDQGTKVSQLLSAIETDDSKATIKVLSKATGGTELSSNDVLTDGTTPSSSDANIIRVTPQDSSGSTKDYTIIITPVTQSSVTTIKSTNLNKVTTTGNSVTIVDTVNVKTAADLLAEIETIDSNATIEVLGSNPGTLVPGSHVIVPGTTVLRVTAQDNTAAIYTIN